MENNTQLHKYQLMLQNLMDEEETADLEDELQLIK